MGIGARQVIGAGLACGVGRVRRVRRLLAEGAFTTERSVHFVGRHVQKAKGVARRRRQATDKDTRDLEQREGADDVGVDEQTRTVNRPVDVRFGRKVEHGVGPMVGKGTGHGGSIRDVRLHEGHARIFQRPRQIEEAAGVGELVDDNDAVGGMIERVLDEVRADEPGSAGD